MTNTSKILDDIKTIITTETAIASPRIEKTCTDIANAHASSQGEHVLGFLYYGSSLRDVEDASKMLDFYVIVDSYKTVHKGRPLRQIINRFLPPVVYYYEREDEDGVLTTCKYSLISLPEFERRCGRSAFLSIIWGRFSQPSLLYFPKTEVIKNRILTARAQAVLHVARSTESLFDHAPSFIEFWARGFRESYRTELRPESSEGRSREIVAKYSDRYEQLMQAIYGAPNEDGSYKLPQTHRSKAARQWFLRRLIGRPVTAIRVLCSAATFDGGLDYVLRKIDRHSGVTIEPSPFQRKHPVLCAPVLGWKLWRKGAFG